MAILFPKSSISMYKYTLFPFLTLLSILTLYYYTHSKLPTTQIPQTTLHFHSLFLSHATNTTISSHLRHLTLHPHLSGTPSSLPTSSYVAYHFSNSPLQTHHNYHSALLSYPSHSSLSAHFSTTDPSPKNPSNAHFSPDPLVKNLSLSDPLPKYPSKAQFSNDPFVKNLSLSDSVSSDVVSPYHAYSPSGSAHGKAVFVNYGRRVDYNALKELGVNNLTGCVALVRRGMGLSRYDVAEIAAEKGVAAVVMYTESEGDFTNGVERGTVMRGLGDPLTPGWGSGEGGERLGEGDEEVLGRFPKIPSMPISEETAEVILGTLGGVDMPLEWRNGGGSVGFEGEKKGVGPGPTMLNFSYKGEKKIATLHNIFAIIRGSEEPDRFVLLGNHRDAWTYGAVDPNSGTAALLDIARRFALLKRLGWKPRRSIVLCSWDGEELGMIGSTEWVEQNLMNVGSKAVAYLNVDCAVQGPGFFVSATPQLDDLLVDVLKKVKDPDSEDMTLYTRWIESNKGVNIERLSRADSDFAPFLHHAGVPSVDMYYGKDFPVYHTAFDSYSWMTKYGDPSFMRHVAVSNIWGLLALRLADDAILRFNYISYAHQLQEYTDTLNNLLEGNLSLHPITSSIQELAAAAKDAQEESKNLLEQETLGNPLVLKKRALNDRLMSAERGFLDSQGLQGRRWFKHLVYGPAQGDRDIKMEFYPGLVDAISESRRLGQNNKDNKALIQHEIWRVARAIQRAALALRGDLF